MAKICPWNAITAVTGTAKEAKPKSNRLKYCNGVLINGWRKKNGLTPCTSESARTIDSSAAGKISQPSSASSQKFVSLRLLVIVAMTVSNPVGKIIDLMLPTIQKNAPSWSVLVEYAMGRAANNSARPKIFSQQKNVSPIEGVSPRI